MRWGERVRAALAHAFAVPADAPLTEADAALLSRIAAAVARRGLAVPAIMALESLGPLAFLGGQALHALAPVLDAACPAEETTRLAAILERRGGPRALAAAIEAAERGRHAA
jgi:hypothetical protein